MKKDWLSIIIPAYNPPGGYLRKMLDAITAQMSEYPNVEIVIVDDGSDESLAWTKEYANVKFRRKRNAGVAAARNTALKMATGEYIAFLDADDEIFDNYLSTIFGNMRDGYDWVSYDWLCDNHKEWALQTKEPLMINCAVWAYSFRADFIGDLRFDESMKSGSDTVWLHQLLTDDSKHKHDNTVFYNYRWAGNDNSICHRKLRGAL